MYKIQWLKSSEAEILPGNMTEKERRTNIKGDLHVVIIIINNGQSLAKRGGKIVSAQSIGKTAESLILVFCFFFFSLFYLDVLIYAERCHESFGL